MRVLITGGRGKAGSHAARALKAAGHRVTLTDLGLPPYGPQPVATLSYLRADLTDFGATIAVVLEAKPDVIVHTAGIPQAGNDPATTVFATNMLANFHIIEAVAQCGVRRLVYTSSETALGFITAEQPFLPDYLPVDEEHPRRPQEAYSLSKALGEDLCDALVRRCSATAVSIRPSLVLAAADYQVIVPRMQRASGPHFNHWSYVDAEDLADLIRLAAEADTPGHEVVYAAQPDNLKGSAFTDLVREAFGERAPRLKPTARLDASGIDCSKAQRLFGWQPVHSWRDRLAAADG